MLSLERFESFLQRDRVKCGGFGGKYELCSLALERQTYQILSFYCANTPIKVAGGGVEANLSVQVKP